MSISLYLHKDVSELSDSVRVLLFSELQHDYQPSVPILCGGTRLGLSVAPECRAKVYNPSRIQRGPPTLCTIETQDGFSKRNLKTF